jgi:hypothetical protein
MNRPTVHSAKEEVPPAVSFEWKAPAVSVLSLGGWICLGLAFEGWDTAPLIASCVTLETGAFVLLLGLLRRESSGG